MSNQQLISKFFSCYQQHDFSGMHSYLAESSLFTDFAFSISGQQVKTMWHWFCITYPPRTQPIEVPEFSILESVGDCVHAKYRVKYLNGKKQRPVDYFISAEFKIQNGLITEQHDIFLSLTDYEFAHMAFGLPASLRAATPLLRFIIRIIAKAKLAKVMREIG